MMKSHTQFEGSQSHWLVTQSCEGLEVIVMSQDVIVKITQRQYVTESHCEGHSDSF